MPVDTLDLELLKRGNPPNDSQLLARMTLGRELWLDRFQEHYLHNYIASGGSKVKVLVGNEGTGKTHLLRCAQEDARELGYETVFLSARQVSKRLNDLPSFYSAIAAQINKDRLVSGLCCRVADELGYKRVEYDGMGSLLPLLVEAGLSRIDATREIREAAGRSFRNVDFGPSFTTFAFSVAKDRMLTGNEEGINLALKWLSGEKLDRREKRMTGLFERLQKTNARYWLNSLIHLLKLAGMTGLVVIVDDLEVITDRSRYTPTAIKDTCELIRQFIDDVELLNGFLLILAGRKGIVRDEKRGFPSYEALWMRLQTGLVSSDRFNPFADMVDVDAHLAANGGDFPQRLSAHLVGLLSDMGVVRRYRDNLPDLSRHGALRAAVIENALMIETGEVQP